MKHTAWKHAAYHVSKCDIGNTCLKMQQKKNKKTNFASPPKTLTRRRRRNRKAIIKLFLSHANAIRLSLCQVLNKVNHVLVSLKLYVSQPKKLSQYLLLTVGISSQGLVLPNLLLIQQVLFIVLLKAFFALKGFIQSPQLQGCFKGPSKGSLEAPYWQGPFYGAHWQVLL